ncbi:hypothetical protein PHYC_00371 [Phycisphaerales bacterium]|nr:hypothetical protein PHYC_00371 [Phycisphaerales bacterium]
MSGHDEPIYIDWPAERFYWAVLDCPGVPIFSGRPHAAAGLDLQLAEDLPEPIADLHAVYSRLDERRVLACAARRSDLASLDPRTLSLRPAAPPAFGSDAQPGEIELLVGDFEPAPLRRARMARARWVAAAVLGLCTLGAFGLLRRAGHWDSVASNAAQAARAAAAQALPDEPSDSPALVIRLRDELDLLRRTRRPSPALAGAADAAVELNHLLAAWPKAQPATTDSLSITPTSLALSVGLDGDAKPFLGELGTPPGWRREEPRISRGSGGGIVQATVQFRREASR